MMVNNSIRLLAIVSWALCSAGCALLPSFGSAEKRDVGRYLLSAPVLQESSQVCDSLMINAVRAAPGYGGAGLLYSTSDTQLKRYAYAQWADTLPRILRTVLAQSLHDAGVFSSVLNGSVPSPTANRFDLVDIQLVQRYQGEEAAESVVEFSATLRLFGLNPNVLLHSARVSFTEQAGIGPEASVQATQRIIARLIPELIQKTRKACVKNNP